jgi:glycosyltransferase involved in cell wall biosynthesis
MYENFSSLRKQLGILRQHIYQKYISIPFALAVSNYTNADVSFFFNFHPSPYGGGNQFLKGLWREFTIRGFKLENNRISPTTKACLFNSHNFHHERLRKFNIPECFFVHRVDGPLSVYRGSEDRIDHNIWKLNIDFANATIFQSNYSIKKHAELGMQFVNPHVIHNAPDPAIFHSIGRIPFDSGRKIRLVSVSWSNNPNKGGKIYKWLEENLNWDRFEYTHIGRTCVPLERAKVIKPIPSKKLAEILRQQDIYIIASKYEPCSNSLIEALSCGLPIIYLNSGSHPEIVGKAGMGFLNASEIPDLLDQLVDEYEDYQKSISAPLLTDIADRYLKVLGILPE